MDCGNCNRNAHYRERNGRSMGCENTNSVKDSEGNMNCPGKNRGCTNCGANRYENRMHGTNNYGNRVRGAGGCENRIYGKNNNGNMIRGTSVCDNQMYGGSYNGSMNRQECMEKNTCERKDDRKMECGCMKEAERSQCDEGCDRGNEPVDRMMIAMSYVPWQKWEDIYSIEEGLDKGTIFAGLDKPYIGRRAK